MFIISHIYIYIYIYIDRYVYTYMYIYIYIHTYIGVYYMCVYIYIYIYLYLYIYIYIYMFKFLYLSIYMFIYLLIYCMSIYGFQLISDFLFFTVFFHIRGGGVWTQVREPCLNRPPRQLCSRFVLRATHGAKTLFSLAPQVLFALRDTL